MYTPKIGAYTLKYGGLDMEMLPYELLKLRPTTLRILIELYSQSHDDEPLQISVLELSESTKIAKSTIREHLKTLETKGFLQREEVLDELGRHMPKYFYLTLPFAKFVKTLFAR